MENVTTNFALALWPIVSIIFFGRLPLRSAVAWTILGGQLLLPVGAFVKFPMIPVFDKTTIPSLCILVGCLLSRSKRARTRGVGLTEFFLVVLIFGPVVTSELNGDALFFGERVIAGVGLYDAISAAQFSAISLIPFFVGRWYFRDEASNAILFKALVLAMAVYSLLLLFEVRFSPQLHYWVYGYYPSDFVQAVRSGEFRPMAFMGHGLIAARFVLLALFAAVCLWTIPSEKRKFSRLSAFLAAMIYFCRTLAVLVYAIAIVPLIAFARPRVQIRVAVVIAALALLYPTMRALDLFPTKLLLQSASVVSGDRANSLQFRFDNEDELLAHALQRPWFGWGRYGRNRVYDENGKDNSVTDGQWIITMGQFGVFGFFAQFGLLCIGIFRARSAVGRATTRSDQYLLATLALMMAVTVIDLLPNSGLEPWTWLLCGALAGRTDALLATRSARAPVAQPAMRTSPVSGTADRRA